MFCQRALECSFDVTGIRRAASGNVCSKSVTPNAFLCAGRVRGAAGIHLTHVLILSFTSAYTPEGGQWAKNLRRLCGRGNLLLWSVVTYVSNDTSSYGHKSCICITLNISRLYPENGDTMLSLRLQLSSAKPRGMTLNLSVPCIFHKLCLYPFKHEAQTAL